MKAQKTAWNSLALILIFLILAVFLSSLKQPEYVLLSFDAELVDEEHNVNQVLDVLEKNNATATFFVVGEYAEKYPEIVENISRKNEIACHSYSHPAMTKLTFEEKEEEIKKCLNVLKNFSQKEIKGFRAPYHKIDKETYSLLEKYNFSYDSSQIENYGFLFPKSLIKEIKISSFSIFPASDVINLYYLKMPANLFFYFFKIKKSSYVSMDFHPHHIAKQKEGLDEFIKHYKQKKAKFITYKDFSELEIR